MDSHLSGPAQVAFSKSDGVGGLGGPVNHCHFGREVGAVRTVNERDQRSTKRDVVGGRLPCAARLAGTLSKSQH